MELASLRLIFLLPLLGIQRPVVVTKKNGSHNPGEPVSYLLQINYIYILYFMIMKWFAFAEIEKMLLVVNVTI